MPEIAIIFVILIWFNSGAQKLQKHSQHLKFNISAQTFQAKNNCLFKNKYAAIPI